MIEYYMTNEGFQVSNGGERLAHLETKDGWTRPMIEQLVDVASKILPEEKEYDPEKEGEE